MPTREKKQDGPPNRGKQGPARGPEKQGNWPGREHAGIDPNKGGERTHGGHRDEPEDRPAQKRPEEERRREEEPGKGNREPT